MNNDIEYYVRILTLELRLDKTNSRPDMEFGFIQT